MKPKDTLPSGLESVMPFTPSTPAAGMLTEPVLESLMFPEVLLNAPRLVTAILMELVKPMPVAASNAKLVAVMVLAAAVLSRAPPVARCNVLKPGLNDPATLMPPVLLLLPICKVPAMMLFVTKLLAPKSIRFVALLT
ncbi:MAG: hypothetical protein NTW90_09465 [Nitrosospira sp.]|nr:hypothetical protein [Nitrosospira sp.]